MPFLVGFIEFDIDMIELELAGLNINSRHLLFDVILQDAHGLRLINFDWEGNGFTLEEAEYGVHEVEITTCPHLAGH